MPPEICRICGVKANLKSIIYNGNDELLEILRTCANIEIDVNDKLPKQICDQCEQGFQFAFRLRKIGEQTERKLREELKVVEESPSRMSPILKIEIQDSEDNDEAPDDDIFSFDVTDEVYEDEVHLMDEFIEEFETSPSAVTTTTGAIELDQEVIFAYDDSPCVRLADSVDDIMKEEHLLSEDLSKDTVDESEVTECQVEAGDDLVFNVNLNFKNDPEKINIDDPSEIVGNSCFQPSAQVVIKTPIDLKTYKSSNSSSIPKALYSNKWTQYTIELSENGRTAYKCLICEDRVTFSRTAHIHHCFIHTGEKPYKCQICDKDYRTANSLATHLAFHSNERKHTCKVCNAAFKHPTVLYRHMKIHNNVRPHRCNVCGICFIQKFEYNKHMERHRLKSAQHKCTVCQLQFLTPNGLRRHQFTEHGIEVESGETFHCDLCDNIFKSKIALTEHKRSHAKPEDGEGTSPEYPCGDCIEVFQSETLRTEHKLKVHPTDIQQFEVVLEIGNEIEQNIVFKTKAKYSNDEKTSAHVSVTRVKIETDEYTYRCPFCDFTIGNYISMSEHLSIHGQKTLYKCDLCAEEFNSQESCKSHRRISHEGVKQYVCEHCGMCFRYQSSFLVHKERHMDDKRFKCQFCPEQFGDMNRMKMHTVRVHVSVTQDETTKIELVENAVKDTEAQAEYVCLICNNRFAKERNLRRHIKRHDDESHKCLVCGKEFRTKNSYDTHQLIHLDELPFSCPLCEKGFRTNRHLRNHMRIHTGEKPYQCDICPMQFRRLETLKCHKYDHIRDLVIDPLQSKDAEEESVQEITTIQTVQKENVKKLKEVKAKPKPKPPKAEKVPKITMKEMKAMKRKLAEVQVEEVFVGDAYNEETMLPEEV